MSASFQYEALVSKRWIRILKLQPGTQNNVLCELIQVNLDDRFKPNFEALSYVWGAINRGSHIICSGYRLLITGNCYSALLHLRRKRSARFLWVDSICI